MAKDQWLQSSYFLPPAIIFNDGLHNYRVEERQTKYLLAGVRNEVCLEHLHSVQKPPH